MEAKQVKTTIDLTSARVRLVTFSPDSKFRREKEKLSPPARPMPMLSQNRICPMFELTMSPGSRCDPNGTSAWNGVVIGGG